MPTAENIPFWQDRKVSYKGKTYFTINRGRPDGKCYIVPKIGHTGIWVPVKDLDS